MVDDVVEGFEDPVREPIVPHERKHPGRASLRVVGRGVGQYG
jgi:hypothetical protein